MNSRRQPRFRWILHIEAIRKPLWALLACAFCLPAAAAPRFDSLLHQPYAVRSVYFYRAVLPELHKMPLAEAIGTMDNIERQALAAHDPAAALEVRIARLDFRYLAGLSTADEKLADLEKLLSEPATQQRPEYTAAIMADLGNCYFGVKHNYARAFDYLTRAYTIATGMSSKDFPDKKPICLWLGNRYYTLGDLERAEKVLLDADTIANARDNSTSYNCKNTLGLIYRAGGQYDRAERYFYNARNMAARDGDTAWMAIASGNIGITWYLVGHYKEAIPLLWQDVSQSLFKSAGYPKDNGMNSLLILADIHLKMDSLQQLATDIALAQQYMDSCRDRVKLLSMLYRVRSKYLYARGDYKAAYQYQDSATCYTDSLGRRDNIYKLAQAAHRHELGQAAAELSRANGEKKLLASTRNVLLVCILLLAICTFLLISQQKLRYRLQQERLLSEKAKIENDLGKATTELESYTRRLREKSLAAAVAGQDAALAAATTAGQAQNEALLQQLYQSTILTDEEWDGFKRLFARVHRGYLQRLREKMPDLTPADTRFIVLSKLQLSNKEMAGILGVQADTIRSHKHRFKKRFCLPEETDIRAFVDSI